jgi:hypothetical protein
VHRELAPVPPVFERIKLTPQFIEDNEDIVFYKNYAGVAKYIPVEEGGNVSDSGVDMTESK